MKFCFSLLIFLATLANCSPIIRFTPQTLNFMCTNKTDPPSQMVTLRQLFSEEDLSWQILPVYPAIWALTIPSMGILDTFPVLIEVYASCTVMNVGNYTASYRFAVKDIPFIPGILKINLSVVDSEQQKSNNIIIK